jgi:hypothetical protein
MKNKKISKNLPKIKTLQRTDKKANPKITKSDKMTILLLNLGNKNLKI